MQNDVVEPHVSDNLNQIYPILFIFTFRTYILYKESIAIEEKFDFEILIYLYVLRSPEFNYGIYTVVYACMCVRERVNTIASKRCIRLSLNLVCML